MAQLAYQIPDGGRKKTILRIPESHVLYLCPNACGRRQGIRALKNGEAEHASFLSFAQQDVALGDYVGQIIDAAGEVLARVKPTPRVLTLYVNCIDDFLGTDGDALIAELSALHPGTRFLLSHINPIAADVRGGSPALAVQENLYAPLEPVAAAERDAGLNVMGTFVPLPRESEVYEVLAALGTPAELVRDLPSCATYDDYQAMARSRFALSVGHVGDGAATQLEQRLGIGWMSWPACYDLAELDRRYAALAGALGAGEPEGAGLPAELDALLEPHRARARQAIEEARAVLGDMPVYVDTAASLMPFSLAEALIGWGLNVRAVFALHSKGWDDDARARLEAAHPEVSVITKQGYEAICGMDLPREAMSLGRDAAFLVRARHLAGLYHDEGHFGFDGAARLAHMLVDACATVKEWD